MIFSIEMVALFVLFLANAFFSASETAMTALSRLSASRLEEEHPKLSNTLAQWRSHPGRLLTTILVSSNLCVIAFSFVASSAIYGMVDDDGSLRMRLTAWVLGVLSSVVLLLAAEITPKLIAKKRPETIALWVLPLLQAAEIGLGPLVRWLLKVVALVSRPFGISDSDEVTVVTEDDLRHMVSEGERGGLLEKEEREMIHSIMEFGDTVVKEVMVPRTDMQCMNVEWSVDECLDKLIEGGYSRWPVYKGHFDNVVGILYSKDFLSVLQNRNLIILQDVIRPAFFVPETKMVSELLREFKRGKIHMAMVVDEFGGTAGLVTLEDLLEEIVGEIRDEYDTEDGLIQVATDGSAVVDAKANLKDLNVDLKLELPEDGETSTVGGFVSRLAQRVPKRGESVMYENVSFTVLEANSKRLIKLKVRKEFEKPIQAAPARKRGKRSKNTEAA